MNSTHHQQFVHSHVGENTRVDVDCGHDDDEYEMEETLIYVDLNDLHGVDFTQYLTLSQCEQPPASVPPLQQASSSSSGTQCVGEASTTKPNIGYDRGDIQIRIENLFETHNENDDTNTNDQNVKPTVHIGPFALNGHHELNIGSMLFFRQDEDTVQFVGDSVSLLRCELAGYDFHKSVPTAPRIPSQL
jgi:hypothetical protein